MSREVLSMRPCSDETVWPLEDRSTASLSTCSSSEVRGGCKWRGVRADGRGSGLASLEASARDCDCSEGGCESEGEGGGEGGSEGES